MFIDHLNHCYLITKTKLNGRETKQIEELTTFDFIIIYYKKVKNPVDNLSRQFDFKDDNELSIIKYQPFPSFLFKFQEYLKDMKNNPVEKQNINSNKIPLFKNVLNLVEILQDTNSIKVLPVKSKFKSDPIKKQNIDSNKTSLLGSVLSLIEASQGINSIKMLSIRNKSQDKCSGSVLNSIGCNQMRIPYLELTSIIKRNNDQMEKVQFVFVVGIIDRKLYILQLDRIERIKNQ